MLMTHLNFVNEIPNVERTYMEDEEAVHRLSDLPGDTDEVFSST